MVRSGIGTHERWAWATVDLDAVRHNVGALRRVADGAMVWAVVKADAYGHGAVPVARAVCDAGAAGLAVALVQEGLELRAAGIGAPILVLAEQPPGLIGDLVAADLTPTVYSSAAIDALTAAAVAAGRRVDVHVKVDTGMRRVGVTPGGAPALVDRVRREPALRLAGVFTHLAMADEPDDPGTAAQLTLFDEVLASLRLEPDVIVHAANSAGLLAHPGARRHAVRTGIALYGIAPGPGVASHVRSAELRPALSLRARVSFVKRVAPGDAISYGWRHRFERATTVATVPIGYADGVPRRFSSVGGEVLVGGSRRPIVGVVTMDQLMVDCGDDEVAVGDEVVLIGHQGAHEITATEWADRLGTVAYEIVCAISARVPRRYVGDAANDAAVSGNAEPGDRPAA